MHLKDNTVYYSSFGWGGGGKDPETPDSHTYLS